MCFSQQSTRKTAQQFKEAIAAGHSNTCTIDRDGADHNRELSLKGVPTRKGKDRDEWSMAMCTEGGDGANVKYIAPDELYIKDIDQYMIKLSVQFAEDE